MLPNASPIGFTGTPIELTDKNTRPHKHGYPPDKQEKTTQTVPNMRRFFPRHGLPLDAGIGQPIRQVTPFDSNGCHVTLK
jgi:hypothetical protein